MADVMTAANSMVVSMASADIPAHGDFHDKVTVPGELTKYLCRNGEF